MDEGVVAKWHKAVGDHVEAGDLLLEISTDKATVEHNAIDSGWIRKILINDGQSAIVNQAIAIVTEEEKEDISNYQPTGISPPSKEITKEKEDSDQEKKTSDGPKSSQRKEGLIQPAFVPESPLEHYEFGSPVDAIEKRLIASPLARKLAHEKGLDLSTVKGTGPDHRIMSRDLERAQATGTVVFGRREVPSEIPGSYVEETLTPMRKVIAQRLQESKTFIPHFYVRQTIDVGALVSIREQLSTHGVKVSINDLIIKGTALTLRQHPIVNSGYNSVNNTVIKFKTIDISVAVSVKAGLITPIIRHADFKNVGEISVEIRSLAKRAKEGKLEPHEYKGGSFTVSNMGMYGITDFQAIINPPQAAILAVSGIEDTPIVKSGSIVIGKTMNLSLSVDHRVVDGVAAAEFMKTLQKFLENPAGLLI